MRTGIWGQGQGHGDNGDGHCDWDMGTVTGTWGQEHGGQGGEGSGVDLGGMSVVLKLSVSQHNDCRYNW